MSASPRASRAGLTPGDSTWLDRGGGPTARTALHAGRIALARAEDLEEGDPGLGPTLDAAEEAYRRALELDPGSAPAWFGLGRTAQRAGRGDAALAAFEHARQLGWSASLDLELGTLYLERGRRADALGVLWPIAQDPHGGPATEKARERLDEAGLTPQADADASGS